MSRKSITAAVKTLLEAVSGIGVVDDRTGGTPTWRTRPRPVQAYWMVTISGASTLQIAAKGQVDRTYTVRVEGWMPRSYVAPNSADTWRDLLDLVETKLLDNHRTLSGTVDEGEVPQTVIDNEEFFPDGEDEVLCHHAVIEIPAIKSVTY